MKYRPLRPCLNAYCWASGMAVQAAPFRNAVEVLECCETGLIVSLRFAVSGGSTRHGSPDPGVTGTEGLPMRKMWSQNRRPAVSLGACSKVLSGVARFGLGQPLSYWKSNGSQGTVPLARPLRGAAHVRRGGQSRVFGQAHAHMVDASAEKRDSPRPSRERYGEGDSPVFSVRRILTW